MEKTSKNSQWWATVQTSALKAAPLPAKADVLIVGGGITGLTAASRLARAGKKVVLVEMNNSLGRGETGQTTAHLTQLPDAGAARLRQNFGDEAATLAVRAHASAIDSIEAFCKKAGIHCDFERVAGYLFAADKSDVDVIDDEYAALQALGVTSTRIDSVDLPFKTFAAVQLPNQAQFHPLKYLQGLVEDFEKNGGVICRGVRYEAIERSKHPHVVSTSAGKIKVKDLVFATHTPATVLALQTKQTPQRTYAISVRCNDLPKAGLFYDTEDPYHYIRRHRDGDQDLLIVGGCDHRVGETQPSADALQQLEKYARKHFDVTEVVYRWSGQVFEPTDGLPFIGLCPGDQHVWVITGMSGQGMTWGTVGAQVCADGILGIDNPLSEVLRPSRIKPLAQASEFMHHNKDVSAHMVGDRLKAWIASDKIAAGEGKVARHEGHVAALYNDGETVHAVSPVCPHAGCFVQWNTFEKSWDCPCHGSRFTAHGKLLCGPAVQDLAELD